MLEVLLACRISRDFSTIIKSTCVSKTVEGSYEPLVIILELVLAAVREVGFCESKISSLKLLCEFSEYLPADITLDRIVPYMVSV